LERKGKGGIRGRRTSLSEGSALRGEKEEILCVSLERENEPSEGGRDEDSKNAFKPWKKKRLKYRREHYQESKTGRGKRWVLR